MPIRLATHLYRNRHGMFYFRYVIPKDLRKHLNKSEVRFSLKTEQRHDALYFALQIIADLPRLTADLRRMKNDEETPPPDYFKLWWLMLTMLAVYFATVMADSAALTSGLIQATPLAQRGAAMGVYSLLGFGAGSLAPLVFGVTLDAAHSYGFSLAWTLAFGTLGIGGFVWSISQRFSNTHIR